MKLFRKYDQNILVLRSRDQKSFLCRSRTTVGRGEMGVGHGGMYRFSEGVFLGPEAMGV